MCVHKIIYFIQIIRFITKYFIKTNHLALTAHCFSPTKMEEGDLEDEMIPPAEDEEEDRGRFLDYSDIVDSGSADQSASGAV